MPIEPLGAGRAASRGLAGRSNFMPPPEVGCPPISDVEIVIAARSMNLAGNGAAGAQMLVALFDDSLGPRELAQRINAQPGIAVRVLRVANSAYYGQAGRVGSVDRAAAVLGLKALRGIATAACFDRMTTMLSHGPSIDLPAFRRHSLAAACAAQALAQRTVPTLAEEAFTAGILHDLGIVMLWKLRPQHLVPSRAEQVQARSADVDSAEVGSDESRLLLATHAHCGRLLLETWRLPLRLSAAVGGHDAALAGTPEPEPAGCGPAADPGDAVVEPLTALLVVAEHVAHEAGFGLAFDPPHAPPGAAALAASGIGPDLLERVTAELPAIVTRLSAVFGD